MRQWWIPSVLLGWVISSLTRWRWWRSLSVAEQYRERAVMDEAWLRERRCAPWRR